MTGLQPHAGCVASEESPRRVLFVRTDRLGETVLNLPALAALRGMRPRWHLTLLVQDSLRELFEPLVAARQIDALETTPGLPGHWLADALRLAGHWRSTRYDVILISNPTKAAHVAAWLAGIRCRVGYDRKWGGLLTHRILDGKALGGRHEVEYNLDLVNALGIHVARAPSVRLPIGSASEQTVAQLLDDAAVKPSDQLVAVHPWTSNPRKQWPADRVRELLQALAYEPAMRVVLIGGPEEQAQVGALGLMPDAGRLDFTGRLSIGQLAALLARVSALVSNDSGPVHVAAAVGTPAIALFGTTDPATGPGRWGPWGAGHTVIHQPSMEAISVDDVLSAIRRTVAQTA